MKRGMIWAEGKHRSGKGIEGLHNFSTGAERIEYLNPPAE